MKQEEYNQSIEELIGIIRAKQSGRAMNYKKVFPIARGGYYPGIIIAKALNLELITKESEIDGNTIVVDDLIDSGSTMQKYIGLCGLIAVVFIKCHSLKKMKACGTPFVFARAKEAKEWIVFPDEHESTIEDNITRILQYIGEDTGREGLRETPARIVRMYKEIYRGYDPEQKPKITTFENESHEEEMIIDSGTYYSMCEHHMMPFFGKYVLAYIPDRDGRILGISKIGRIVDYCSARLQLQERLASDIVSMLEEAVGKNNGFAIMMQGEHLCKTMRGVKKEGTMSVLHCTGKFKTDKEIRLEFLQMAHEKL